MRAKPIFALGFMMFVTASHAAESTQPYIDELRRGLQEPEAAGQDSYIDSVRKKIAPQPTIQKEGESYIDALKRYSPPAAEEASPQQPSFIERERTRLAPRETGGAIEAFREGRSQLKARREGTITQAIGVRLGPSFNRDITANAETQLRSFNELYGSNFSPEIGIFYEFQPFHSEWLGNVGVLAIGGMGYFHGTGIFQFPPLEAGSNFTPASGNRFGANSGARFQFFSLPAIVALNYRFNLLRVLRPFVMAGPGLIGYVEKRGDSGERRQGFSRTLFASGGVSLLLDWLGERNTWDLYAGYGVKHYYLTLEYNRFFHLGGPVSFAMSGISAGLTFEY